ncbi:PASTA domain-containing protein [Actinomadura barringtoniae]|uniref:PASTA domain-containing protein n=1 Tax=Actinomadura barringtoniae TaxID=1427535 RepID=A0A939T285_9ACTN|nr:PASTA domain-containing protein [Actinomadura barringtoniae]MBO2446183.1 PASTA domain-containing protein [Actinomadura barringtoniae]
MRPAALAAAGGLVGLTLLTSCADDGQRSTQFARYRYPKAYVGSSLSTSASPSPATSPSASPSTTQNFTMPDVKGKNGRDAYKAMASAGYKGRPGFDLKFVSDPAGKRVFILQNWTVVDQSVAAGTSSPVQGKITLKVHKQDGS